MIVARSPQCLPKRIAVVSGVNCDRLHSAQYAIRSRFAKMIAPREWERVIRDRERVGWVGRLSLGEVCIDGALLLSNRKHDVEGTTGKVLLIASGAFCPDVTSVGFDYTASDGQPETRSTGLELGLAR